MCTYHIYKYIYNMDLILNDHLQMLLLVNELIMQGYRILPNGQLSKRMGKDEADSYLKEWIKTRRTAI